MSMPNSTIRDIMLIVWNLPWWDNSHHENQKMLQTGALISWRDDSYTLTNPPLGPEILVAYPVPHWLPLVDSRNVFLVPLSACSSETSGSVWPLDAWLQFSASPAKPAVPWVSPIAFFLAFMVWMNGWMDVNKSMNEGFEDYFQTMVMPLFNFHSI